MKPYLLDIDDIVVFETIVEECDHCPRLTETRTTRSVRSDRVLFTLWAMLSLDVAFLHAHRSCLPLPPWKHPKICACELKRVVVTTVYGCLKPFILLTSCQEQLWHGCQAAGRSLRRIKILISSRPVPRYADPKLPTVRLGGAVLHDHGKKLKSGVYCCLTMTGSENQRMSCQHMGFRDYLCCLETIG